MSLLFDDLKKGLEEAIAYEQGTGEATVKTYTVLAVKEYNKDELWEDQGRQCGCYDMRDIVNCPPCKGAGSNRSINW